MANLILSSVAVVRVRFIRARNNLALAEKGLIATPNISPPRLTVPGQHGFIDLEPVSSTLDPDTGVGYFDLVATDDAQVNETFSWTITGDGWTGFSRTVSVPQTGSIVEILPDGTPAVWLNQLADFTGSSGPGGPDTATRTYVDDALDAHEAAADPHPQYAMDAQGIPAGGTLGQALVKTGSGDFAVGWGAGGGAGGGDLPEYSPAAQTAAVAASGLTGKTLRLDTTSAAITQTIPAAVAGRQVAVGQDAGQNPVTIQAASRTDTCGTTSGSSTVTDTAITAADQGRLVSGAGVPVPSYVGTVTPGASFVLSSSPNTSTPVNATATAASVALTVSDMIGIGTATSYTLVSMAMGTSPGVAETLRCTNPGRWRLVGKVLPQTGLDDRYLRRYVGATTAANTRRLMMKLRRGAADASVLVVGDSTGNASDEWVYLWAQNVASRFPVYTVRIAFWDETGGTAYQASSTIQTGTGARTLTVWNCSAAGRAPGYVLGSRWDTAVVPTEPDLVFVNHGHNLGDPASSVNLYAQARANYLQLTEELAALFPFCGIVLIAQNPSLIAGRETWQARKADVLEEIAMLRGYGFIDVHQAFLDRSDMATLYGDTTHPNAAGSQLWASVVIAATAADASAGLAAVGTPPLLAQARNFLGAGYDFSDWPSTTPTGWAATNATLAKETTIRETGAQACRITPAADGAAQIEYAINPSTAGTQGLISGQLLCFAVRLRAPATHLATARVQLADNTGTGNAVAADLPVDTRDRFSWLFVVKRITTSPTYIGCRVIARTTGTAAADLIVDRAHLLLGAIPRCG